MIAPLSDAHLVDYPVFAEFPEFVCRTTTRIVPADDDGPAPFNLGCHGGPNADRGSHRRRRLCAALGLDFAGLTTAEQVHGNRVAVVDAGRRGCGRTDRRSAAAGVDGLATNLPDTPLLVLTADCCPVVLFDPVRRATAVLHAGRKGTAGAIALEGVRTLVERFGSRADDLRAAVGPSIGPCCYQVGDEIRAEFPGRDDLFARRGGRLTLDLWSANRDQLLAAGLQRDHIQIARLCTACRTERFFSYRREGSGCGLLGTIAAIRPRGRTDGADLPSAPPGATIRA